MNSFRDVISAWPNRPCVASDCGESYGTINQWYRRDSVPAEYWLRLVDAAECRGLKGVTLDLLARLASRDRDTPPAPTEGSEPAGATAGLRLSATNDSPVVDGGARQLTPGAPETNTQAAE